MATATAFPTGNATAVLIAGTTSATANTTTGLNADDGTKASATTATKNTNWALYAGTFGLQSAVPSTATINSLAVEAQNNTVTTSQGTQFHAGAFVTGTPSGANLGTIGTEQSNVGTTVETIRTFSALARPGGGSWTWADLADATFYIRVRALQPNNTTSTGYAWDYVKVTVDYSLPASFPDRPASRRRRHLTVR